MSGPRKKKERPYSISDLINSLTLIKNAEGDLPIHPLCHEHLLTGSVDERKPDGPRCLFLTLTLGLELDLHRGDNLYSIKGRKVRTVRNHRTLIPKNKASTIF